MNRPETDTEKLERQQGAITDLRLEEGADEETHWEVIREAAHRATRDHWPDMAEGQRQLVVSSVVGLTAINYQLSVLRNGWATGRDAQRIHLDQEVYGPKILITAYSTAESETVRMRDFAAAQAAGEQRPSLEERLRRYLKPGQ